LLFIHTRAASRGVTFSTLTIQSIRDAFQTELDSGKHHQYNGVAGS
jgi:hypothetical protein